MKKIALILLVCISTSLLSQEKQTIQVRRFVIELKEGQVIGSLGKSQFGEEINHNAGLNLYGREFRFNSSFNEDKMKTIIEESFSNSGVPVEGYDNIFIELRNNTPSKYAVAMILNDLDFDYNYKSLTRIKNFHSIIKMKVLTLDLNTDELVFDKSIISEYYTEEEGFKATSGNYINYFEGAVKQLVRELLKDADFSKLLNQVDNRSTISFDAPISITASSSKTTKTVREAINSTVTIKIGSKHGSGAIISSDGIILTCHHNIYGNTEADVILSNGIKVKAKVLRKVPEFDVAILKIDDMQTIPIPISSNKTYEPTELTWAIGTPGFTDLGQTITKGVISGHRNIDEKEYIQTDASVSPGNSGGPLLDKDGKIIGIVNAKVVDKGMEGIGFAIPISIVLEKLNIELK